MDGIYRQRLDALREAMGQAGLTGVIVHQSAYLYHLTGWLPPEWAAFFLVVGPREHLGCAVRPGRSDSGVG